MRARVCACNCSFAIARVPAASISAFSPKDDSRSAFVNVNDDAITARNIHIIGAAIASFVYGLPGRISWPYGGMLLRRHEEQL